MKLSLEKVKYKNNELSPAMSKETLDYHKDNLAKSYVDRFNRGEGDLEFNEAGAFLHNLFFPQFKSPSKANNPNGAFLELVKQKFGSYTAFKEEFFKVAMGIQGSGWVYLDTAGEIKTIRNHEIKKNIALLVDWWEHAWALDYQSDKKKYLNAIWKIIDWYVINDRLNSAVKSARKDSLLTILKIASKTEELPDRFPKEFRRWLRESCYSRKIDARLNIGSRCRLSNYFFNKESYAEKLRLYNSWLDSKRRFKEEAVTSPPERYDSNEKEEIAEPEQLSLFE